MLTHAIHRAHADLTTLIAFPLTYDYSCYKFYVSVQNNFVNQNKPHDLALRLSWKKDEWKENDCKYWTSKGWLFWKSNGNCVSFDLQRIQSKNHHSENHKTTKNSTYCLVVVMERNQSPRHMLWKALLQLVFSHV